MRTKIPSKRKSQPTVAVPLMSSESMRPAARRLVCESAVSRTLSSWTTKWYRGYVKPEWRVWNFGRSNSP